MPQNPNHPDSDRSGEHEALPQSLLGELRRAYPDKVQTPSRVDDAVFRAMAEHFAEPAPGSDAELKPGALAWIRGRPLATTGLAGALIAASVLVALLIIAPSQQPASSTGRSIAMESQLYDLAPEEPAGVLAMREAEEGVDELLSIVERRRDAGPQPGADSAPFGRSAERRSGVASMDAPSPKAGLAMLPGDVNADGAVTIADALLLARMIEASGGDFSDARFDMLGDGTVSRADADAIARLVVRLDPTPETDPNTEGAS